MSDLSLPTDCEALSARIRLIQQQITTTNEQVIAWTNFIQGKGSRPGGISIPGAPGANATPDDELKFAQQKLNQLQRLLGQLNTQLGSAIGQFNSITPTKCKKPDTSSCEKKNVSTIFGECGIPPQIRSSDRLQEEIEALEAQLKNAITQAKVCLGVWQGNQLPEGVLPVPTIDLAPQGPSNNDIPIDIDAPWDDMILTEAGDRLTQLMNHPCLDDNAKQKIKTLFTERDDRGRFKNFTIGGKFKGAARIKAIFRDSNAKIREILRNLEAEDNDIRKKIAEKESLKLQYGDETSETNVKLRQLIKNTMNVSLGECFKDNPLQYSVSTTITATKGPGAPPEIGEAYSITKTGDEACVTYDEASKTMILDTNKALGLLGPGGCALLSDSGTITVDGVVYPTGPAWIEPVTISSTIIISNGNNIENCMSNKFFEWVEQNTNALYLVSYAASTSNRRPNFNVLNTISINYCISPPVAE